MGSCRRIWVRMGTKAKKGRFPFVRENQVIPLGNQIERPFPLNFFQKK